MISQEFLDKIDEWKEDDLVIGFMDNNFDGLDLNHLKMLKYASDNCDKLIIGLYDDYVIKMCESIDKPKYNYEYRRELLNALDYVDLIVCIDEVSPKNIIKSIKPHKIFVHQYNDTKMEDVEIISKLNDIEIIKMDSMITDNKIEEHKYKAVLVDIDGTIYNEEERKPYYDILMFVGLLQKLGYHILVSTYRDESKRKETEEWLSKYITFDKLFMRPIDDRSPSYKWKDNILQKHILNDYEVDYIFENDEDDFDMYSEHNLTSLLVKH